MDINTAKSIIKGAASAFIDADITSSIACRPQFLSNNYREGRKVLTSIEEELSSCQEFCISVAFMTLGGITPLLQTLSELESKGIPGKILTTDYLNFSEPRALKKLAGMSNIELRMYKTSGAAPGNVQDAPSASAPYSKEGFHTKGYIFRSGEIYRIITGSSNMTHSALTLNREWNTRIVSTEKGEYAKEILAEFNSMWDSPKTVKYNDFIDEYAQKYKIIKEQRRVTAAQTIPSLDAYRLEPNTMQTRFIMNLKDLRADGEKRGLLISATGTGKTYASAFAMRELGFKRVLFLVHRNQIATQAEHSYKNVFGSSVTTGVVGGGSYGFDADLVFATMQTMCKDENLSRYAPDHFDCIVYDEAHHTAAGSYKKIMDYFDPKFSLGMTATPDRRDSDMDGRNIYEIFDHNIACEIRLQQAMEEDLLCPFHYFGITDITISDSDTGTRTINKNEQKFQDFRRLTSDERVKHVMKKAEYFGFSGDRVKGLIFCSRIEEARELSEKFNRNGWRTAVVTGSDSEDTRKKMIERLVMPESEKERAENHEYIKNNGMMSYSGPIDYILSIDIFSEGVDVPEINQVIMLRPTESPVVFVQQLGRGLRKADGKEYVVVLDFIGNYSTNFMIPIALSGDRTYNKDNIRRFVLEGVRVIPGASTLHFDEISRKMIFRSIDGANFSDIRLIKQSYADLKNKLGRIPSLMDFDRYGEMDVLRIFDNDRIGSYYKFLVKYEKEYSIRLADEEADLIEFISKKLAAGKRIHELELIERIMTTGEYLISGLADTLYTKYGIELSKECAENIINIMTNEFPTGAGKKKYEKCVFIEKMAPYDAPGASAGKYFEYAKRLTSGHDYKISSALRNMLENKDLCDMVRELVRFGISRYRSGYSERYAGTDLVLYKKYTYEDVCRLLNWEHSEVPINIGGYKYDQKTKTFPVFINYEKEEGISATTKYEDRFTSDRTLTAISKSGRSLNSDDVQNFLHAGERGITVHLFVRKNKEDKGSKEFYYLGKMSASGDAREIIMPNTNKSAVEINWELDKPVREDIFEYITK